MKQFYQTHKKELLLYLGICFIFCFPYFFLRSLPIEHDTFFHLSRIEHYSESLRHGILFPSIYPYENAGFGYGSPLFYSDILLLLPALLRLFQLPLVLCYKLYIFLLSYLSAFFLYYLSKEVTQNKYASHIAAIAYLFNNYHITDVYIRGALGEILALTVMPIFLLAIYRLFFQQRKDAYFLYLLSLSLMALSHNITFIFVVILSIIFFFIQLPRLKSTIIIHILLAAFLAFLLTSFYTLPMIEQLLDQKFVVAYYQDHNTTPAHALNLYHYFSNETIFGYSGVDIEKDKAMVLNIGYFLSIIPLFYLTLKKEKKSIFLTSLFIIGYTTLVLPIKYIPWQFLSILSFMQFPWRLFTISSLCLSIVSAYTLTNLKLKHMTYKVIACILLAEGIYHIAPVMQREFVMKESQSWKDIQSGALCDPYYSADYMRIELAGGEYLPYYHVNFKDYPYAVRNHNNMITEASLRQNYLDLEILFPADNGIENILPITYYKGYQVYDKDHKKVETYSTSSGFVAFTGNFQKEYHCLYEDTPLKTTCLYLSFFTLIFILYLYKKQEA